MGSTNERSTITPKNMEYMFGNNILFEFKRISYFLLWLINDDLNKQMVSLC